MMIRVAGKASLGESARLLSALVVAVLAVASAALGCSPAVAASTSRTPVAPSYLFSIPTASGSLTGPDDRHLTLRMTGARNYLTRFTDRPLRQAFIVANVDFARRFHSYFAASDPNAVLSYTPRGGRIPVSIVLTIGHARWDTRRATWTFSAVRILKQPDNLPGSSVFISPPPVPNPRAFTHGTLVIDNTADNASEPSGFAARTPVEMGDGTWEPIGDVLPGDSVMSTDASGNPVPELVHLSEGTQGAMPMVYLGFGNGRTLIASGDAMFASGLTADQLTPGDSLLTVDGTPLPVTSTRTRTYIGVEHYLLVAGPTGTFFVNGVLVVGWS